MLTKVNLYSKKKGKIVEWIITREKEIDSQKNEHEFIALRHEDEEIRISPNATDEYLKTRESQHKVKYGSV